MNREKRLKQHVLVAIGAIVAYIEKTPLNGKKTEQLAQEAHLNRKLLQEGFKELVGMGVKEFCQEKRMEAARQMLKQGEKSIKEISVICNYKSQSAFTTAFKTMHGITPTEWQARHS